MTAGRIYAEAKARGLEVLPHANGKLCIRHNGKRLDPEFEKLLRANKGALLAYLGAQHLIKQINLNEFKGCHDIARSKLVSGLKNSHHPLAGTAIEKLFNDG